MDVINLLIDGFILFTLPRNMTDNELVTVSVGLTKDLKGIRTL